MAVIHTAGETTAGLLRGSAAPAGMDAQLHVFAERLATAEEAAGALIYDWDVAARTAWRSESVTRILGWRPDEIAPTQEGWAALRHPDDEARVSSLRYDDYLQADDRFVLEYRVRHKNGHYVWVLDSGRVFRDVAGVIIRVAGATIDISARKKTEQSMSRQANLIELSFEPIFVWHPERGIIDWNHGAEALYGYSKTDALGQVSHALLRTVHPMPLADLLALLNTVKSWTGEVEHRARDGRRVFVESRHQAIETDGETLILETNHDITERKRADAHTARMAAVASASHDVLVEASLDGLIEAWNPAAVRLFGYAAEEAIGRPVSMLAAPARHKEQSAILARVAAGESVSAFETQRLRKNGTAVDVLVAFAPIKSLDGSVLAISKVIHDLSERKDWEARQRLMTRELAHRVKNSFAVLQAILRSTLKSTPDPAAFAVAFSGRLHSLSAAQDVLTASDWKFAELGALARHQLSTYALAEGDRLAISGPPVNLGAEHSAPLALIFNELASNATKFGAMSVPEGRIDLAWRIENDGGGGDTRRLILVWRESGGPKITAPGPRGFGSTLIEKSLAGARVESRFGRDGLVCTVELAFTPLADNTANRLSEKFAV